MPIELAPGATVCRDDSLEDVVVTADTTLGIELDGVPIDGATFVSRLRPDGILVIYACRESRPAVTRRCAHGADYGSASTPHGRPAGAGPTFV